MLEPVYMLNNIILSMATKQYLLDGLESEMFKANIYTEYINGLIMTNIQFMGLEDKESAINKYKLFLEKYIHGEINEPQDIIKFLMDD